MSAVTPHFIKKLSNGVERVVSYLPDGVLGQTFCLAELGPLIQRGLWVGRGHHLGVLAGGQWAVPPSAAGGDGTQGFGLGSCG